MNNYLEIELRSIAIIACLLLSACETPEERLERETQFDGQTLDFVIAKIGQPNSTTSERAVWSFESSYDKQIPIQHYINGHWVFVGYRRERVSVDCTFTATLSSGRVATSHYQGNSCTRYAPSL